ncbi:MAG: 2-oxoglutarate dehydrogenase E1 component [Sphingobacteriia bacterium]|nr:2-oxoglutarate dehydrogenase E1 component [Sphingobacteriia bacterium]
MSDLKGTSYLFGANSVFIEELYERYLENPNSVDENWRQFFANFNDNKQAVKTIVNGPSWCNRGVTITKIKEEPKPLDKKTANIDVQEVLYLKAIRMVDNIRLHGHKITSLDPLNLEKLPLLEEVGLDLPQLGFSEQEIDLNVDLKNYVEGIGQVRIRDLHSYLLNVYSSTYGVETAHIRDENEKLWLYKKFEAPDFQNSLNNEIRKQIAETILHAEGFEQFLHVKFPGAKRFSVEGGESSIMAVDQIIEKSAELGVNRLIMGMAHRGRLNMLTKIMGKPYVAMLSQFQGNLAFPDSLGFAGDVKYHLGYSSIRKTKSGNDISLSMVPNPSHLETVNPVVMGKVRAEQTEAEKNGNNRSSVVSLLIHGDAAVCGQGVVAESLMLGDIPGYEVKGTLHIIVNNQVGFTANPWNGRSSRYPSEFAKAISIPIFHVNGDDAEAVAKIARLMVEYRQTFNKDAIMNLVCFRLHGHNETDEPFFTQPVMYERVNNHEGVATKYSNYLINSGVINETWVENCKNNFKEFLNKELEQSKTYKPNKGDWLEGKWSKFKPADVNKKIEPITGVDEKILKTIGQKICEIPNDFNINSKIARQLDQRKKLIESGENIDWATAEALAYGSLLLEGNSVRLSGQDAGRGTFSHRHSVLHDQKNGNRHIPLNNISDKQANFEVHDSNLSEYAVMGYEYGFALGNPNSLVIWEAQFGDFANGAQIIIDQYIAAAETKWLRMNGLVLLLPHGFEGQGPEHSSARLERFLQLCAEDNMQVAYPTTPASIFHLLRRQVINNFRKPLIIMSPKSLLRHKLVTSNIKEFGNKTSFKPVIGEIDKLDPNKVQKVVFCTGKIYYDLYEEREKRKDQNVALIRLEQLYPFAEGLIKQEANKYKKAKFIWCQEEPKNMGSYTFIAPKLMETLGEKIEYVGRKEAASPATGYSKIHTKEQQEIIQKIFS